MSGPFAVTAAARFPDRIAAAASYHSVFLATDKPDSPHLLADKIRGDIYLAFGEKDHLAPPAQIETVRDALQKARARFEIEVYPGVGHGFVFPTRANYVKAAAERHWERLFDLFGRTLA
jgi:carboxymethylenebutenolidase